MAMAISHAKQATDLERLSKTVLAEDDLEALGPDQHTVSENFGPTTKQPRIVRRISSLVKTTNVFTSAVRQPKPNVECLVHSWHGYCSLKMFEAQPGVCRNKVTRGGACGMM